jgi:hypothetical protein
MSQQLPLFPKEASAQRWLDLPPEHRLRLIELYAQAAARALRDTPDTPTRSSDDDRELEQ